MSLVLGWGDYKNNFCCFISLFINHHTADWYKELLFAGIFLQLVDEESWCTFLSGAYNLSLKSAAAEVMSISFK